MAGTPQPKPKIIGMKALPCSRLDGASQLRTGEPRTRRGARAGCTPFLELTRQGGWGRLYSGLPVRLRGPHPARTSPDAIRQAEGAPRHPHGAICGLESAASVALMVLYYSRPHEYPLPFTDRELQPKSFGALRNASPLRRQAWDSNPRPEPPLSPRTERRSSSSAPRRGSAEPRPRGCSGLGEPRPALPSF